ncbi:MAG: hypothetical protein II875_07945 [Clostridia bacterium]|nr:hypothetical protein [Clostridia bacterium]
MLKSLRLRALTGLKGRFDSDLFTYEQLRSMFIPLLLDQLFIFIIGLLSSAMVSSSGEGSMSAFNYGNAISSLAYAIYSAVSIGAGIVIARAKGSGDAVKMREAIGESCVICTLIGSVFGVALSLFGSGIVKVLYPSVSDTIAKNAGDFLRIFGLSIIPYSLFNVIFAAFRSVGDTKGSLILTLVINTVHLLCSLLFINMLDMGVPGSALSYLVARIIGVVFAVVWLMRPACQIGMRFKDFTRFDVQVAKDIVALGIPISVEQVLFQGGMLIVQMFISGLTVVQTDAHGVANSMFMLYYAFAYSMTNITNTVCGQCIGAKKPALSKRYCINLIFMGRIVMLIAVLILFPMTPLIMKLYSPSSGSISYIYVAVALGALPMPLIWCDANIIATANRTAGDTVFTTVVSLTALGIGRVAFGYLFTVVLKMGIAGIWIGQIIEWLYRAVVFHMRLRSGKWLKGELKTIMETEKA